MKKFLIFLGVILGVTAMGFGTYFLVRNNETFAVEQTSIYLAEGDSFAIDYEWKDKKAGSTFKVEVGDDRFISHLSKNSEKGREHFVAVAGGHTTISFSPSNSKIDVITVNVYVGDGSILSPYYISTSEQLQNIKGGNQTKFTLGKFYKQINDIDLAGVNFAPIGADSNDGFTGEYDGGGYKISNLLINNDSFSDLSTKNAGMFDIIGVNGRVVNLKLQNTVIQLDEKSGYVGTVAGESYGEIERVEIISSRISVPSATAIGGVVGKLKSIDSGKGEDYTRHLAEIDRVGINQLIIGADIENNIVGYSGVVGGLVGQATGGTIVYSYVKGEVHLNKTYLKTIYGGLVGYSETVIYKDDADKKYSNLEEGIRIRDSYSSIELNLAKFVISALEDEEPEDDIFENVSIGGIIGSLYDEFLVAESELLTGMFKIFGTYYNKPAHENVNEIMISIDEEGNSNNYSEYKQQLNLSDAIGRYYMSYEEIDKSKQDPKLDDITDEKEDVYFPHNYRSFAFGLTEQQFSDKDNFLSHYTHDRIYVDGLVEFEKTPVYWNFESPWSLSEDVNGGYPYLNYENILISNSVEVVNKQEIRNYNDLQDMELDGHYVIIDDIYMPKNPNEGLNPGDEGYVENSKWTPWIPIGSESTPFTGSLQSAYIIENGEKRLFSIKNLIIEPKVGAQSREYGGLFGVTSNVKGGYIKNIVIENANVSGYLIAGALVGSNGYEYTDNLKNRIIQQGLDITNVTVLSSNVEAFEYAGGVIGRNYGSVKGVNVTEAYEKTDPKANVETSLGNSTITLVKDTKMKAVGGVAGHNEGTIFSSLVYGGTKISAEYSDSASQISAGGIAGSNAGKISQAAVYGQSSIRGSVERTVDEVLISSATTGYFGGIAGSVTGEGSITNSLIKGTTVSADTNDSTVFVGGITGLLTNKGTITNTSVVGVALTGYAVGGAVGEMDITQNIKYSFEKTGLINTTDNKVSMSNVEVRDEAVLTGSKVGGLIAVMKNGIVSQALVRETTLNGTSKKSVKAGLVVELPRVVTRAKTGTVVKAGVIQEVYVATKFGGDGKNYAMSQSEFLQTPIVKGLPFTDIKFEKEHGFVVNYLFDKTESGKASKPKTSNLNTLKDWFSKSTHWLNNFAGFIPKYGEQSPKTTAEMYLTDSYKAFNFSGKEVWTYKNKTYYPDLTALIGLEDKLISNKITVTITNNNDVYYNVLTKDLNPIETKTEGNNIVATYNVENGGKFSFELEFSSNVSPDTLIISVRVNDVELVASADGSYNIEDIYEGKNIVIDISQIML